ncbi:MAG: DsbA family protein [Solirubrobacterales bacterium]
MRDLTSADCRPPGPEDHVRGPADGPPVVFFADFTCPDCAVAAGKLKSARARVHFRHLAISSRHRRAVPLGAAAEAAAAQGAFWPFHDALFADPGRTDDPQLWRLCEELGLSTERFDADRRSPAVLALVADQTSEALRAGAITTPSFLVDGSLVTELPPEITEGR